jgi:hypothetical protein
VPARAGFNSSDVLLVLLLSVRAPGELCASVASLEQFLVALLDAAASASASRFALNCLIPVASDPAKCARNDSADTHSHSVLLFIAYNAAGSSSSSDAATAAPAELAAHVQQAVLAHPDRFRDTFGLHAVGISSVDQQFGVVSASRVPVAASHANTTAHAGLWWLMPLCAIFLVF